MDLFRGDGFIKFSDFKELCFNNEIDISESDGTYLSEQGFFKTIDDNLHINYRKLLPAIFPKNI